MTTYTTIPDTDIDQDSPVTQPLMTALRDNPIAIAEGASDAPVVAAGWHPYDMISVGDGNDGLIYDYAVDGGVTIIETPAFEDGYDYRVTFEDLGRTVSGNLQLTFQFLRDGTSWQSFGAFPLNGTEVRHWGMFEVRPLPLRASRLNSIHFPFGAFAWRYDNVTITVNAQVGSGLAYYIASGSSYFISKVRLLLSATSTTGKVYLEKRRHYGE